MKPYARSDRVAGLIHQVVAELLRKEIKDPRLAGATITGVKVTRDLRHARIYYATAGDENSRQAALQGFRQAHGFLKRELAEQLELRYMPELAFFYDDAIDTGDRIEKLLKTVRPKDEPHS
jgi:ribosome-binding factor A